MLYPQPLNAFLRTKIDLVRKKSDGKYCGLPAWNSKVLSEQTVHLGYRLEAEGLMIRNSSI
jgi:hypothetical protein